MARIRNTSQTFAIAQQATLAETRQILVDTAKREHAKVMGTVPRPGSFTRIVDGGAGVREEAVKANGVIVYLYPRIEELIAFAMDTLFDLSPVLSGEYRNGHRIFLNGMAVGNLKSWQPGDEISITNTRPYARKIEMGDMTMRVPGTDQVYTQAVKIVRARYGNLAQVLFAYRGVVGGSQVNASSAAPIVKTRTIVRGDGGRFGKGTRTVRVSGGAHNKSENRFPALLIMERK